MPSAPDRVDPVVQAIRAYHARNGTEIAALACDDRLIAGDLTQGSWRGHWLARELSAQLGIDPPADERPVPGTNQDGTAAANRAVARSIDIETEGDRAALVAHRAARAVADAVIAQGVAKVLVLAPPAREPWMREDLWFLRFLHRSGAGDRLTLVFAEKVENVPLPLAWTPTPQSEDPLPQIGCADASVPGIVAIDPEVDSVPGMPTMRGFGLLLPEARNGAVGSTSVEEPWLTAWRELRQPSDQRDAATLAEGAMQCFAEGGHRQAVRLLEAAEAAADDPVESARHAARAQSMRIACLDFAAAAARPDPAADLPDDLRRDLSATKAWGLVMSGRPEEADPLFAQARTLSVAARHDPLWLYLLNISALAKFRLGKFEDAFAFEHTIEAALAAADPPPWHLKYINAINLARLCRATGQLERSLDYYLQAFAINLGLRSDSDQLYLNICQASLCEAMGQKHQALLAWLRAGLHWLAMPVPEALAPRVATAMRAGEGPELVAKASIYLHDKLAGVVEELGLDLPALPGQSPRFARPGPGSGGAAMAIGAPGWGVLVEPGAAQGPIRSDQAELADIVSRLMALLGAESDTLSGVTVLVDGCHGTELPTDRDQLLALAVRHRAGIIRFAGRRTMLDPRELERLERAGLCEVGAGVVDLLRHEAGIEVHFRRSREPLLLESADARLVEAALGGAAVADLLANDDEGEAASLARIRRLETLGVLSLRLPPSDDAPLAICA